MRIDSGIIGMDSARSYASETKRNFTLERKTYGGILERREGNLSFRGMLMGENQEEAVEEDEGTKTEGNDVGQGTVIPMWNGVRTARTTQISDRNELEMIDKRIVMQRLTGDGKRDELIAPLWSIRKFEVLNAIDAEMSRRGAVQGDKV